MEYWLITVSLRACCTIVVIEAAMGFIPWMMRLREILLTVLTVSLFVQHALQQTDRSYSGIVPTCRISPIGESKLKRIRAIKNVAKAGIFISFFPFAEANGNKRKIIYYRSDQSERIRKTHNTRSDASD